MQKGKFDVRIKLDGEKIIDNKFDSFDGVKDIFGVLQKKFK